MTELQAAILLGQLSRLDGQMELRERNAKLLTELMDFDEVNRHLIEKITAIGIRYSPRRPPRQPRGGIPRPASQYRG